MDFDIDKVIKEMINVISVAIKESSGDIKKYVSEILESEKESLNMLAQARLRNEIDDEVFRREIEREKKVVEAELLTIDVMANASTQKAVNGALDVFVNALKMVA